MRRQSVDPVYTQALRNSDSLVSFVVSMRYTTLKEWPGLTQALFIGVVLALIVSTAFAAAWTACENGGGPPKLPDSRL